MPDYSRCRPIVSRCLIPLVLGAALAALALAAPASAATPWGLDHLRMSGVPVPDNVRFHDTILRHPGRKARAAAANGSEVLLNAPDGTAVTVTISDQYGQTQQTVQAAQNTVNFLAGRLHSFELGLLKVFVGRPSEIGEICGASEALACYAPNEQRMYVPGEPPPNSPVPVEYIITHEYGHHIANHRKNALGSAFILGPEYWATSQFICAGALSDPQVFFPGDEDQHYLQNPGEGWADTYAHLPENGFESQPFQFSPDFHRDQAAFDAVRRDVLDPWQGSVSRTVTGSLGGHSQKRFSLVVSLDGPVIARLTGPRSANYDLQVRLGGRVVDRTSRRGSRDRVAGTLCAAPAQPPPTALTFVVVRRSGSGPFKLKMTDAG
jgi:hypothetical protein